MTAKASLLVLGLASVALLFGLAWGAQGVGAGPRPRVGISVIDLSNGEPIQDGQRLTALTTFQVRVTSTGGDCAGQFVVTALGAGGAPPSILVQSLPFIVGPAFGSNSVAGPPLNSGLQNDWKVSASCNGAGKNDFDFDSLEFVVDVP